MTAPALARRAATALAGLAAATALAAGLTAVAGAPAALAATTPGHARHRHHGHHRDHHARRHHQANGHARRQAGKAKSSCVTDPSGCGFPDATDTGVPAGATLRAVPAQVTKGTGWVWNPAGWVEVTGSNATLSGLAISGNLDINGASNVTVSDVQIVNSGQSSMGISLRHTSNVTIENCTISGANPGSKRLMAGIKDIYGDSAGLRIIDNNISLASTGVQVGQGLIQGNYIHDMGYIGGDHINGVTSNGGSTGQLTITANTILVNHNQTDAVGLFEDFGVQANRTISNNLLAGGSYPIYGGNGSHGATSNIVVTGNRIATNYYVKGGQYGPATAYNSTGAGNTWSGNVWDNTGQTIPAP